MSATILNGKKIAENILNETMERMSRNEKYYKLGIVMVGNDPGSEVYVRMKTKKCESLGISYEVYKFEESTTQEKIEDFILSLNINNDVTSIIVQLPLPDHLNKNKILNLIDPNKDVDGLTPYNLGYLFSGSPNIIPATPKGIIKIIKTTGVSLSGLNAVVVGRSNLVGKPTAHLLLQENCTVTICHSKTKDLFEYTNNADILVCAVGEKHLIKPEMVKQDAICIDVGISREDNKLYGDFHPETTEKAAYITPVPGGVGPVTIACLIDNIVR